MYEVCIEFWTGRCDLISNIPLIMAKTNRKSRIFHRPVHWHVGICWWLPVIAGVYATKADWGIAFSLTTHYAFISQSFYFVVYNFKTQTLFVYKIWCCPVKPPDSLDELKKVYKFFLVDQTKWGFFLTWGTWLFSVAQSQPNALFSWLLAWTFLILCKMM